MLNFGLNHRGGDEVIFPIIQYNSDLINIGSGGSQYDAVLHSGQFTSYTDIVIGTVDIDQMCWFSYEEVLRVEDVSAVTSFQIPSERVNNIMLFNRLLTSEEIEAIELNPGLWDASTTPSHLIEWYPCSEGDGDYINDMLSDKRYTMDNWDEIRSNETFGIQKIAYNLDTNGTLTTYSDYNDGILINGNHGFLGTQWIPLPDEDWSIEVEQEFTADDKYNLSGITPTSPDEERFFFGEITSNRPYARFGDATHTSTTLADGWHKLTVIHDGASNSTDFYVNDEFQANLNPTDFINSENAFQLGWVNVGPQNNARYKNLKIYKGKL